MDGVYLRAKFGCAQFQHLQAQLKHLCHNIKTCALSYNAWKQKYEISLM